MVKRALDTKYGVTIVDLFKIAYLWGKVQYRKLTIYIMEDMDIDKMLKSRPNVNVVMLFYLFMNAIAFDSLYWMVEVFIVHGEFSFIRLMVYTMMFILTLIAFIMEYKRLNKHNGAYMIDDSGLGYSIRKWQKKEW